MTLPSPAQSGTSATQPARTPGKALFVLFLLLAFVLALKGLDLHRGYNSDEPQHMHLAWNLAQGQMQYRDFFDNHPPLFHFLMAPVVGAIENRDNPLFLGRLAMLPFWIIAAGAVGWIAARLYSRQAGVFAALLALACPPLLVVGSEFRTDVLWMALWLLTVAVAVGGTFTPGRAFRTGILFSLTVLTSEKSALLAAVSLASLGGGLILLEAPRRKEILPGWFPKLLFLGIGGILPAAALAAFLAHHGALDGFIQCVLRHNSGVPVESKQKICIWIGSALLLATVGIIWARRGTMAPGSAMQWSLPLRRVLMLLIPVFYHGIHIFLSGFLPLGARQDYLPCLPLLAVPIAGLLVTRVPQRAIGLLALFVLAEGALTFAIKPKSHRQDYETMGRNARALTERGEPVMDLKGESIFRFRPSYYCLETITFRKLEAGILPNTIATDIASTRTHVCVRPDKFPKATYAWVQRYFLPVTPDVWVAGCRIQEGPSARAFEIGVAAEYRLLTADGHPAEATIDGTPCNGTISLAPGSHTLESADSRPLQLIWTRAVEKGYKPCLLRKL